MKKDYSRREFLKYSVAAGAALSASGQVAGATEKPPNIIVIFTDDQGYGDLGCYGETDFKTPCLDRLAKEGMRFTDFYVPGPVCTPSRSALMTGCYPKRLGLAHRVVFPHMDTGLNPEERTIAEVLHDQGYATACIGKWHLGHYPEMLPNQQGFDYFFGTPYSNDMGSHVYSEEYTSPPLPLICQEKVVEQNPDQRYFTRRYTDQALDFIRAHKEGPFFLYLAHNMPHLPLAVSEQFAGKSKRGIYGDVIEELDWNVGRLLDGLEELDLADNTLVIFSSDNGPKINKGQSCGTAGPLRGQKNTTWEGGMRVPCIMRWPKRIPANSECHELATIMDLLPTAAALTDGVLPNDRIIDGKNILPLLEKRPGAQTPYEAFYYYRDDRLQAVRSGAWKLHLFNPEWKFGIDKPRLYNLEDDIGEKRNVAEKHPEVLARLLRYAEEAREDLGDARTGAPGKNVRAIGKATSKEPILTP